MKKLFIFSLIQFLLFEIISFLTFLTSGRGERWASFKLGLHYDANKLEPGTIIILALLLVSAAALLIVYYVFNKKWTSWQESQEVNKDKLVLLEITLFFLVFYYLNGFNPFFPFVKFFTHIFTTWYGFPRIITYSLVPALIFSIPALLFKKLSGNYPKILMALSASYASVFIVRYTDFIVGGRPPHGFLYLNLPASSIHIYISASAAIAYALTILLLSKISKKA